MTPLLSIKNLYWNARSPSWRKSVAKRVQHRLLTVSAWVWRRLMFRTTFIAVSGSVGKTTTKEILFHILNAHYSAVHTRGNYNSHTGGGPQWTILRVRPWHRFAVLEIGTDRPGRMLPAAKLIKPNIAIMLAVKHCHTNTFKTTAAIAVEKLELLRVLGKNSWAVINEDDALVAAMAEDLDCNLTRFGRSEHADLRLGETSSRWPDRFSLDVMDANTTHHIQTQLVGEHWAPSVLAALTTARLCGLDTDLAILSIESMPPFWARLQPITLPGSGAIFLRDDFNGSKDTFEVAFKVMSQAKAVRRIVVTSDFSDSTKKLRIRANELGKSVALVADAAVFIGDYADRSARMAINSGMDPASVHQFFNVDAATEFLKKDLQRGDLVLLKGQTNHHLTRIYLGQFGKVSCTLGSCRRSALCDSCPDMGFAWRPELREFLAPHQR